MTSENKYQTKNFNLLTDPKLACTCNHKDCDKRVFKYLDRLQAIRDDINRPLVVTSGGRCQYHPDERNKKKAGDHQKCAAVDVRYNDELMKTKLLVLAGRHGATRVAVGKKFIHIAWTETDRKDVPTWEY